MPDPSAEPSWSDLYGDDVPVSLVGCNCEHEPDEHGWGCCYVDDCPCDGGWEE